MNAEEIEGEITKEVSVIVIHIDDDWDTVRRPL
jgi:hypothetical protein